MIAALLNPRGKKKYKRKKYGKRKASARRSRSARRAGRRRIHRAYASRFKTALSNLVCKPGARKRWKSLRRQCHVTPKSAPAPRKHGGIMEMIRARIAPGIISRNPLWRRPKDGRFTNRTTPRKLKHFGSKYGWRNPGGAKLSYRPKRRNYSSYVPAYGSNPYWVPAYAMNPGGGIVSKITAGYSPSVLMNALPAVGGVIGNKVLSSYLGSMIGWTSGWKNVALSLGSAGLLGAGVGMIAPRYAGSVFFGGVVETMLRATGMLGGMAGLGDYLTVGDAARARPLGDLGCCPGAMGAYDPLSAWSTSNSITPEGYTAQRYGTFAPTDNANAVSPETMMPQLGYSVNDSVIEGTATEELSVE